ncbi:MAG: hypothetical protein ACI9R3_004947 [Verrucomicrobiales bacterium]
MLAGSFVPPPLPPLVVSEFYWSYQGTFQSEPYRFFELHNRSDHPLDLSGIQLAGSAIADLTAAVPVVLPPDGYALVVADEQTIGEGLPVIASFENRKEEGTYHFSMDQALLDPFGRIFERFGYSFPNGLHGGPLDPLQRIDESIAPNYPENWEIGPVYGGTPGGASFRFEEFLVSPEVGRPGDTIEVNWKISRPVPMMLSQGIGAVSGAEGSATFVIPNDGRQPQIVLTAETEFGVAREVATVTLEPQIYRFWVDASTVSSPGEVLMMNWDLAATSIASVEIGPDYGAVTRNGPLSVVPLQNGGFFPGNSWRYRANGGDLGEAWCSIDFDDQFWRRGRGIFGYGNDNEVTLIRNENFDWVTAYFRRHFQVRDAANVEALLLDLLIDDGAEVYINGVESLRENLPAGAVAFDTSAVAQSADDGRGYREFSVDPSVLVDGDNVIAVGVHNRLPTSEDIAFDLGLRALRPLPPERRTDYTLTIANGAGTVSSTITVLLNQEPLGTREWALANGLAGDLSSSDTDADGLMDLVEFAVGTDPNAFSLEPVRVEVDAAGHLVIRYPSELLATGVQLRLQTSQDLVNWAMARIGITYVSGIAPAGTSVAEQVYRSVIPISRDVTGASRDRFFRLQANER